MKNSIVHSFRIYNHSYYGDIFVVVVEKSGPNNYLCCSFLGQKSWFYAKAKELKPIKPKHLESIRATVDELCEELTLLQKALKNHE